MSVLSRQKVRTALFVLFVMTLVCLPFAVFGEEFVLPLLKTREQQAGALTLISIALLAADSVAPVPATLIIMYLAAKAGWVAGVIGGTIGMSAGVLAAAWLGRAAVGGSRRASSLMPNWRVSATRSSGVSGLPSRVCAACRCWRRLRSSSRPRWASRCGGSWR